MRRLLVLPFLFLLLPIPDAEAETCVQLVQQPGTTLMVNTCRTCRTIRIERRRPSSATPIYRHYTLAPRSKAQLTLRGTGRTRILSDEPCQGADPGGLQAEQQPKRPCVILSRRPDTGAPVLFNGCDTCQAVVTERIQPDGSRSREIDRVLAHSYIPFPAEGAVQAEIVHQEQCPQ